MSPRVGITKGMTTRRPLVAFRLDSEREAEAVRALAEKHADGNVSALIRDALRARYSVLSRMADKDARKP